MSFIITTTRSDKEQYYQAESPVAFTPDINNATRFELCEAKKIKDNLSDIGVKAHVIPV